MTSWSRLLNDDCLDQERDRRQMHQDLGSRVSSKLRDDQLYIVQWNERIRRSPGSICRHGTAANPRLIPASPRAKMSRRVRDRRTVGQNGTYSLTYNMTIWFGTAFGVGDGRVWKLVLTLWRPLLPYGYSYKASCARPGKAVICNFWHPDTLTLGAERQSARLSKITNVGLTRSCTGCCIAVPVWQQWASRG